MKVHEAQRLRSLARTMSLEARIDLVGRAAARPLPGRQAAQARKAIRRWKKRLPFKDGAFASWLARFGLDEQQLVSLVRPRVTPSACLASATSGRGRRSARIPS